MENQRMLSTQEAVVGGTEGGPGPTGVPPTTAAAEGAGGSGPRAGNGQQRPDPAVPEKPVSCERRISSRSQGNSAPCFVAKASISRTCQCGESSVTTRHSPASCRSGEAGSPTRMPH